MKSATPFNTVWSNWQSANISITSEDGEINVFVDGVQMVTENVMTNSKKVHTEDGMRFIADATTGNIIDTKSGYVKGMIDARDSGIKSLQDKLNTLASQLITEVNTIHATGYDLDGNTGKTFRWLRWANMAVNAAIWLITKLQAQVRTLKQKQRIIQSLGCIKHQNNHQPKWDDV